MTTPRIEEMAEELFQYYDDIDCAVTVDQRITAKEQAELWLKRVIIEAHQAGIDEAVDLLDTMKLEKVPHDLKINPTAWQFADRIVAHAKSQMKKALEALQDNK